MWFELIFGVLVCLVLFLLILVWLEKRRTKKLLKKYNPDDDFSKKGEDRRQFGGRESNTPRPEFVPPRPDESEGDRTVSTADPDNSGEDSNSPRETERPLGRLDVFKTLQKR